MKNQIKNLVMIAAIFTGLFSYGNNLVLKNEIKTVTPKEENKVSKPFVRSEENRIYITSLSLDKSPLKVEIYYESSETSFDDKIFSETIENKIDIQRIYRLDKSKKGTYTIILTTKGKSFVEYTTL